MLVSQHPADHPDSPEVSPTTTDQARSACGVNHRVATAQLPQLQGGPALLQSDGEGEAGVTVNIDGITLSLPHLATTVQDVRLSP